jgi:hypothetical protein
MVTNDDDLPAEQHAHMTGAAMRLMVVWLEAVFDENDLTAVWELVDEPLRLALVQSWILLDQDRADLTMEDRDGLADALASPQPRHRDWHEFSSWRVMRWKSVLPPYVTDAERRGFVSVPGLVGVDLESVLVAATTTGDPRQLDAEEPVEVQRFLVRHTPDGVRLAGIGGVLPIPGWPPSESDRLPQ